MTGLAGSTWMFFCSSRSITFREIVGFGAEDRPAGLRFIPVIDRQNCYTRKSPSPGACAWLIASEGQHLLMPLLLMMSIIISMVVIVTVAMMMVMMRQFPDWIWNPG
ncbi:hypothetical protein [Acidiphilium acidophilum]|uniref:Uncharacterized protein n=1 Tax=Acidiphilium acidophilum TaxID=76588 RepID=A0AAW9DV88_ACIAO|nr:hypothetical protein [Acidiphilium acidophilum]MDX5933039.1 hypothetical protein [Acidiphilium acidophilum]